MKNKLINIFLILALVAGLSLLLYPTVSDYWNSLHASQAVASYDQAVKRHGPRTNTTNCCNAQGSITAICFCAEPSSL